MNSDLQIGPIVKAEDLPDYFWEDVNIFHYPRRKALELLNDPVLEGFWETWGPVYGLERLYFEYDFFFDPWEPG